MSDEKNERDAELRTLALIDRIIGLEAEIAHLKYARENAQRLDSENSLTWKVGLLVTYPLRKLRALVRKAR